MYSGLSAVFQISAYILSLCSIIISIWGTLQIWSRRWETFVKKRNLSTMIGLQLSIIGILLSMVLWLHLISQSIINPIYIAVSVCMIMLFIWILLWLLTTRTWNIYFMLNWTHDTLQSEWQRHLNPKVTASEQNWFITHRQKYGRFGRMSVFFGIICFICFCLSQPPVVYGIFHLYSDRRSALNLWTVIAILLYIPCTGIVVGFYGFMVIKMPSYKFQDALHIQWESSITTKLLLIQALMNVLYFASYVMDWNPTVMAWLTVISCNIWALIWMAMICVTTICILHRNEPEFERSQSSQSLSSVISPSRSSRSTLSIATHSNRSVRATTGSLITLQMILEHKEAIHLFIIYLSKNFSIELMLFHIECVQYRRYLMEMDGNQLSMTVHGNTDSKMSLTRFPDNIPVSEIMENDESESMDIDNGNIAIDGGLHSAKMKAYRLYRKYIAQGCEYEINISYSERHRLHSILGDLDKLSSIGITADELFVLFQNCDGEMMRYMKHHLSKFRATPEFDQILSIFTSTTPTPSSARPLTKGQQV